MRLILHGKAAGKTKVRQAVEEIRSRGHRIEVRVTWETGDAVRMAREAVEDVVLAFEAPWLEVEVPGGLHLNLDGEPVEGTSFRFEVEPGRLRFHVGPRCPSIHRKGEQSG